jgi:hypothetical protein
MKVVIMQFFFRLLLIPSSKAQINSSALYSKTLVSLLKWHTELPSSDYAQYHTKKKLRNMHMYFQPT